jgi:putative ABC transport system substrate-binding protein
VKISQNQARRLELLLEMVPDIHHVFVPYNPEDTAPISAVAQINDFASNLGVEIVAGLARNHEEVTELLSNIPEDIDAIFMLPDSTVNAHLADLIAVAIDRKLPLSGPSMAQLDGGALTAYGIIHYNVGAQAAHIANQVLKGADPGELPVEIAEFFLGINLKTADVIGLEIPYEILQQAHVIIRTDEE